MNNEKKLQKTFASWPVTNRFYQTSDGECFFTEPRAINHAQSLEDKNVKLCRRADEAIKPARPAEPKSEKPVEKAKTTQKTKQL